MRKYILHSQERSETSEIAVASTATVFVSSEEADHPIDHAFDDHRGPGGTQWVADQAGEQTVILAFDTPQTIRHVGLEVEERHVSRTQELHLSVSNDGGETYRECRRQEFNFSPDGATFEREEWAMSEPGVTHVRVTIKPDKGGKNCRATLTSLALR